MSGILASLWAEARANGSVRVAVRTAVAYAPETLLPEQERSLQRRDIAVAARLLLAALPQARNTEVLPDKPYVLLEVDAAGLARLETLPGLARITASEWFNWRRDDMMDRQAVLAALRNAAPAGGPPRAYLVAGKIAGPDVHPFQVGLLAKTVKNNRAALFCGGTLVSPRHVVTAAHCVEGIRTPAAELDVLVGARRLDGSGRRIGVSRIFIAPGYSAFRNDAAVLELAQPVTDIAVARLADNEPDRDGVALRVTGWGDTSPDGGLRSKPVDPMQADLPFRKDCGEGPDIICLGADGGQVTGGGDSGGPATIDRGKGFTELVGIASWASDRDSGFTSVANPDISRFIRGIVFAPGPLPQTISFVSTAVEGWESENVVKVRLQRSSVDSLAQVRFTTSDGTATFSPGQYFTSDYWGKSGTVTFFKGQSTAEISIFLVDDKLLEDLETFYVGLSQPSSGWSLSGPARATVTIESDD